MANAWQEEGKMYAWKKKKFPVHIIHVNGI